MDVEGNKARKRSRKVGEQAVVFYFYVRMYIGSPSHGFAYNNMYVRAVVRLDVNV